MEKVIAITGATQGMGEALALELMRLGHRVFGCGRNPEAVARLDATLNQTGGSAQLVDVTDKAAQLTWAQSILEKAGAVDLVYANAAMLYPKTPFLEIEPARIAQLLEVNVKGLMHTARAFLPSMNEAGRGTFIAVSSGAGRRGFVNSSDYCVTKFAVEGFVQCLALEVTDGVSVVALRPGVVNTAMLQRFWGEENASKCILPGPWAEANAPWLLDLGPESNGKSLDVPTATPPGER